MESPSTEQPTLRVMRLYNPAAQLAAAQPPHAPAAAADGHALSAAFRLPENFGDIYVGEVFSSFVSVINALPHELRGVGVAAKLLTPSSHPELADQQLRRDPGRAPVANPVAVLPAGDTLSMVVEHELVETGTHTLHVVVSYHDWATGEPKQISKFFRFQAVSSIEVKMRNLHAADGAGSFVEAQVRNCTGQPMVIDDVRFEAEPPFEAEDCSPPLRDGLLSHPPPPGEDAPPADSCLAEFDRTPVLGPEATLQLLYRVSAAPGAPVQKLAPVGRVAVQWRSAFGLPVTTRSRSVKRKGLPVAPAVEVTALDLPQRLPLGQPARCTLRVRNAAASAAPLQLQLRREEMDGVFVSGRARMALGELAPGAKTEVQVELLPLVSGVRELRGVVVLDTASGQEHRQGKIGEVLVC